MGFCSEEAAAKFLEEAPPFEAGLVRDGLILIKLWLTVGREMQLKRFHARRHHPLKRWKLTDVDIAGLEREFGIRPTKLETWALRLKG
jgi:polyphosphate kinase 2 (PPK2 family)